MTALSIQDELGLRPVRVNPWWAPRAGTAAAVVQAVVRYTLATLGLAVLFAMPGLLELAVTAWDGGVR